MQPLIEDLCLRHEALCKQSFAGKMIDSMWRYEDLPGGYPETIDDVRYCMLPTRLCRYEKPPVI